MAEPENNPFAEFLPNQATTATDDPNNPFAEFLPKPAPGLMESFGRGAAEGATFGYDDKLGLDKEAREASRAANPLTHFAGELAGGFAPMAAAAILPTGVGQAAAAGRGAQLAGRAFNLLRSAFLPSEINTVGQGALQGAKLGATYGALSGSGHADVDENDTAASALLKRATGAAKGSVTGAAIGAPLGGTLTAGANLAGRVIPALRDVFTASSTPELQGIRDVLRQMGYDNYSVADLARLRADLADPAQAPRFANLNLIEALESRPLQPAPNTGELQMPVKVSPNLRDHAQDMANIGGAGRADAVESFATRRNEMNGNIQRDIDTHFGTGNAQADEAALQAQKEALSRRYDRIRAKPLQSIEDLGTAAQQIPEFDTALKYAAKNDFIRMMTEGNASAEWTKPWSSGDLGKTIQTLSPDNILDIHHALVLGSKPPIGGPTAESVMYSKMKNWFSDWVDNQFRGHENLRRDYQMFKRTMEADEMGGNLPINTGGADHPSLVFLDKSQSQLAAAQRTLDAATQRNLAGQMRYQYGRQKNPPKMTAVNDAQTQVDQAQGVIDSFRKAWGERWKQELNSSVGGPNPIVGKGLTPEAKSRALRVLGPDRGQAFIQSLYNKKQQTDWSKTLFGGPDTAYKLARNQKSASLWDAIANASHGKFGSAWSNLRDMASARHLQARADQGNALMSRQGPAEVTNVIDNVMSRMGDAQRVSNPLTSLGLRTVGPAADAVPGIPEYQRTNTFPRYRP